MIGKDFLEKYATKNQTSFLNVAREYLQHCFLAGFYKQKGSTELSPGRWNIYDT